MIGKRTSPETGVGSFLAEDNISFEASRLRGGGGDLILVSADGCD